MTKEKRDEQNEVFFNELSRIYLEIVGHKLPEAKKYKKGQQVYTEGQVPKGVYYIKKGSVNITRNNAGKPITVRLGLKHNFIGYLSLLKHWDYTTTATTIENAELYFIPKQVFLKAIHTDNKFANIIIDTLCSRVNESNSMIVDLITKEVQQRLAVLLLTLEHTVEEGKDYGEGFLHFSKKDLAAILNIKPETLSRNLAQLSKDAVIKLHKKDNAIEILSKQKLLHLSKLED